MDNETLNKNLDAMKAFCDMVTKEQNSIKDHMRGMEAKVATLSTEVAQMKTLLASGLASKMGSGPTTE